MVNGHKKGRWNRGMVLPLTAMAMWASNAVDVLQDWIQP